MKISEIDLAQRAVNRYVIVISEGESIYLADRLLGIEIPVRPENVSSSHDFQRYVIALSHDLERLTTRDVFVKYKLNGFGRSARKLEAA